MNLGWTEMLLIAGVALLLFGPSKLPGLGKSMGQAIRGFKKGLSEDESSGSPADQQISHSEKENYSAQKQSEKKNQS